MTRELAKLRRNLVAGLGLTLFLPVSRLAFRIDVAQLLLLLVLSALIDVGGDWLKYGPDAMFSWRGAGSEVYGAGVLVLGSAVIAVMFRQPPLTLAVPVLAFAAYPLVQVVQVLSYLVVRWDLASARAGWWFYAIAVGWTLAIFVRCVVVALEPARRWRWPRAIAGGLLLLAPLWFGSTFFPNDAWWRAPMQEGGADPRFPNPAAEPVLAAQKQLLDDALAALEDERPGVTDLYFVGFGGSGGADAIANDVEAAQHVMGERWGTGGRSIALINSPRTLLETPIATVSNLRETLTEIGAAINPDEDVVMLYLAGTGREDHSIAVDLAPLELAPLTPGAVRRLLDDAGIQWRIVVVSACFSGGFVDALRDDQTLVISSGGADRASAGCGNDGGAADFGEALFQQGMAAADSILGAFDLARARMAERGATLRGAPKSVPQLFVGPAMADKLKELDRGRAQRRAGQTV